MGEPIPQKGSTLSTDWVGQSVPSLQLLQPAPAALLQAQPQAGGHESHKLANGMTKGFLCVPKTVGTTLDVGNLRLEIVRSITQFLLLITQVQDVRFVAKSGGRTHGKPAGFSQRNHKKTHKKNKNNHKQTQTNKQTNKQTNQPTNQTKQTNQTKPNQTKPNQTKPNQTNQPTNQPSKQASKQTNQTKPNQTKPNQQQSIIVPSSLYRIYGFALHTTGRPETHPKTAWKEGKWSKTSPAEVQSLLGRCDI